jgi:hypothetical protein
MCQTTHRHIPEDSSIIIIIIISTNFVQIEICTEDITPPPLKCVPGALSPGIKRQGREAYHSHSASVEVNKMWIYTSTPPHVFMV